MMCVSYAATDPVFYGTHKDDYGVSQEKSMDNTPLYRAIKRELHLISDKMLALGTFRNSPEQNECAQKFRADFGFDRGARI